MTRSYVGTELRAAHEQVLTSGYVRGARVPFILASWSVVSLLLERSTDSSFVIDDHTSADGSSVISLPSSWRTRRCAQFLISSGRPLRELRDKISVSLGPTAPPDRVS